MKHADFFRDDHIFDPAIDSDLREVPQSSYSRVWKRALDVTLIVLALPLLVPVFVVLSALCMLDGGAPFYTHMRVGKGGRNFRCYKFRSMVPDADRRLAELLERDADARREWDQFQKLKNDPRITPVGRFLRASSLDELPQLINVLLGDMSLVGPRPFTRAEEAAYRRSGGVAYFDLRPGLTGYWQVTARNRATTGKRGLYDNRYARRMGLLTDLGILMRTVGVVLQRTGH